MSLSHNQLRYYAALASVGVACVLILLKLIAYLLTDALTMLASLADSTIDLLAALVTWFGVKQATRPPDHHHRFGYGKAEPLAALAQGAFIAGSAILLIYESVNRLLSPAPIADHWVGYVVIAVSLVLTLGLLQLQRYVIKQTNSIAIKADRVHYSGDIAFNFAVLAALLLTDLTHYSGFDPIFTVLIAVMLLVAAVKVARRALRYLMDSELPESVRTQIQDLVRTHPAAFGLHDLRTRSDGDRQFIDFHLELEPTLTLQAAHDATDAIETLLKQHFPKAEFTIHQEPAGLDDERLDHKVQTP